MHEVALNRQMKQTLAQFKKNPIPAEASARKMSESEIDEYTHRTQELYQNCQMADNLVMGGQSVDKDPSIGKVKYADRQISHGDNSKTEYKESLTASFGGRSKAFEFEHKSSNKVLPNGEKHSETSIGAGSQNIAATTGLIMERNDDTLSVTQYYIDHLNPSNSLIYTQAPATAKGMPAFLQG